ncbi:hypothetical protein B0H66DRAFT_562298 [Apodospora peruviana]|uniref:Uncharacterized protein n=1 Tax=Apodospora peruviana TaxID=516989 RepID=A0AAE0I1H5_9PEZI|nr:hypothetical protein B0H66DRAFT_562298 [Apodospora peruviana]
MATDPASAAAATSDNYTIDGMNIFWVLFVLTCASAIHPLGSAPGYPPPFARNLRTLPLCSLFDAALLYHDLFLLSFQNGIPLRGAARRLATKRIRQTIPALYGGRRDEDEEDRFFQTLIGILYLDFWPRALANVAVVLIYTKICGFGNVRLSHAIATICFVGWVAMEGFLYLAFGFRVMAKERRLAGYHHHTGDEAVPFNSKRQKVLQSAIGVLVVGQLAVLLWAVISAALPRQAHNMEFPVKMDGDRHHAGYQLDIHSPEQGYELPVGFGAPRADLAACYRRSGHAILHNRDNNLGWELCCSRRGFFGPFCAFVCPYRWWGVCGVARCKPVFVGGPLRGMG